MITQLISILTANPSSLNRVIRLPNIILLRIFHGTIYGVKSALDSYSFGQGESEGSRDTLFTDKRSTRFGIGMKLLIDMTLSEAGCFEPRDSKVDYLLSSVV
ncbi:MAG: hypothetical protein JRE23_16735 [Deltaproteobacteria bacterium]|nr:hypothetical protein [Deltaproteobacteria bacterium]